MTIPDRNQTGEFLGGLFFPYKVEIENIVAGKYSGTCLVSLNRDHMFSIGNLIRFFIPNTFGINQLNGLRGYVIDIPSENSIVTNIDISGFDDFVSSQNSFSDQALVIPVGDMNTGTAAIPPFTTEELTIPGAFINK